MPKPRSSSGISIDEINILHNRARGHCSSGSEEDDSQNLEGFLMLAVLFEGVMVQIALGLLKNEKNLSELYNQRKKKDYRYNLNNAIDDVYLLGKINDDEFKELKKFKNIRNDFFHKVISKKENKKDIEENAHNHFNDYEDIFISMVEKLKRI